MNRAIELAETLEKLARRNTNEALFQAWARLLEVPEFSSDFTLAMAALGKTFDTLVVDIEASNASERSKGLFQNAAQQLKGAVTQPNLNAKNLPWLRTLQPQIDILFMAGDALPHFLVPDINQNTSSTLIKQIEELRSSVGETEFAPGFRQLILSALDTLLLSIRAYDLLGPEAAARVYGSAAAELGHLVHSSGDHSPEQKNILQKALQVCKSAGAAVIFAGAVIGGAHGALEDGRDLLGLGETPATNSEALEGNKGEPPKETEEPSETADTSKTKPGV